MRTILIIYPHWPPSNLAGVHRARLISNFLPDFNWHPIIITVHPKYYEELTDENLLKTVSKSTEVIHVRAFNVNKIRLIGDIGLRGFPFLLKEALKTIRSRKIDFIWIPIPSFYMAMLGRMLYNKTKVPYGIDYIDPWIRPLALHEKMISRAGMSRLIARILEPIAVKNASLISGVSEMYYQPVIERNFRNKNVNHVAMPYGFDPADHEIKTSNVKLPWSENDGNLNFVYAGAFLPNSHLFVKNLFKAVYKLRLESKSSFRPRFYFIGTGNYGGKQIIDYAREFEIDDIVVEDHERKPFLDILHILSKSHCVMVIGSTEVHYTASKTFQAILSKRPVFSIFHELSSANVILKEVNADIYNVEYNDRSTEEDLIIHISKTLNMLMKTTIRWNPDLSKMAKYSSKTSAKKLVEKLEKICDV